MATQRTSLVVAELFLELNGLELDAGDAACVARFLSLAAGELAEDDLARWVDGELAPGSLRARRTARSPTA